MQVVEIEGLKGLDEFIAKLRGARDVYADAQASGMIGGLKKTLHVDWHATPLPGGTPKKTRIEIKVLPEGSDV